MQYYEIDETLARQAKSMWSMSDYKDGSDTAGYRASVDEAYELANQCPDHSKDKALYYANLYAKKYAEYINRTNRIELMCPSVMICGPANFPTRKKDKQNAARVRALEEYKKIRGYLNKIKNLQGAPEPKEPTQSNIVVEFANYQEVHNFEEGRLQLIFTGKPNEATRALLKSKAFKWSPRFKAWQRLLTSNAIGALNGIRDQLGGAIYEI